MRKDTFLTIRCSSDFIDQIKKAASIYGLSQSDYLKLCVYYVNDVLLLYPDRAKEFKKYVVIIKR